MFLLGILLLFWLASCPRETLLIEYESSIEAATGLRVDDSLLQPNK